MSKYNILSEYTDSTDPDYISISPYWIVAIIRFAHPLSFSRAKLLAKNNNVSFNSDIHDLIRERSMLVLTDDVLQMQIQHTKTSYVSSLSAVLMNGPLNYLYEIQPNDWVMAWVVNNETQGKQLRENILNGNPANDFKDGLKFIGRVQSIRKNLQQTASGQRTVRYQLTAGGFKELDASIFYDPHIGGTEPDFFDFIGRMNLALTQIYDKTLNGITPTKIIPVLLDLFVGSGTPPQFSKRGNIPIATGANATKQAPYAYVIPSTVCKLLGQANTGGSVTRYSDVLELLLGVQKYSNGNTPSTIFSPDDAADKSNFRILNDHLLGSFQPLPIPFNNKSVWSLMEEFKNPAVNEMFTCLRTNPNGKIMPTLVVRQLPFSTDLIAEKPPVGVHITRMLELPRWNCHPILIHSIDIGKTDAGHTNFVHVYGQAVSGDANQKLVDQILRHPPIKDEQDMKRSGFRPYMMTVACSIKEADYEAEKWMILISDFVLSQQFTLNGTCSLVGISAPICPGDNFEFDDTVYHIESVTHSVAINNGQKSFTTNLALTHGVRSDSQTAPNINNKQDTAQVKGQEELIVLNQELTIYSGVKKSDNLGYDSGQTIDTKNDRVSNQPQSSVNFNDSD